MTGVTYVVVVAVERYNEDKDFQQVSYATKDAEDLVAALIGLGYDPEDFVILLNEKATCAAIIQKIKSVCERAMENDRIILYFAGHGFYEGGVNYLGGVDAIKTAIPKTCASLNIIMEHLKRSASRHKILFLDCCHSGFEAVDEHVRDGRDSFESDELIYQFRHEEYCIGFASCKSNQKSISHHQLKNGVWSHFLIKALRGDADNSVYRKGLIFSDTLQGYLRKQTTEFVKLNTIDKKDQTPIKFGSETDTFIIADLNPVFDERARTREAAEISFTNISLVHEECGSVTTLPGFVRGHRAPFAVSPTADAFVQQIGNELIRREIDQLSTLIREKLRYKRAEFRVTTQQGLGTIETPDFDYSISLAQSSSNPKQYVLCRTLENLKDASFAVSDAFNEIFSKHFDTLRMEVKRPISIVELIDKVESLGDDSPFSVNYDPANFDSCEIIIEGLNCKIRVDRHTISIVSSLRSNPEKLILAYKETQKSLLRQPDLLLLT